MVLFKNTQNWAFIPGGNLVPGSGLVVGPQKDEMPLASHAGAAWCSSQDTQPLKAHEAREKPPFLTSGRRALPQPLSPACTSHKYTRTPAGCVSIPKSYLPAWLHHFTLTHSCNSPSQEEWSKFITKRHSVGLLGRQKAKDGENLFHVNSPDLCRTISLVEQQQVGTITSSPIAGLCHKVSADPISSTKKLFTSKAALEVSTFLYLWEIFLFSNQNFKMTEAQSCACVRVQCCSQALPLPTRSQPPLPFSHQQPSSPAARPPFWRTSLHHLLMLSNQRRCCDSYRFSHMTSHSFREDKQTSCMFCNICFRGFSGKMFEAVSKPDWYIVWIFSQNNRDVLRLLCLLYIRRPCTSSLQALPWLQSLEFSHHKFSLSHQKAFKMLVYSFLLRECITNTYSFSPF